MAEIDVYDAGFLPNAGGGDVRWWHDQIRRLLNQAHQHYAAQIEALDTECEDLASEYAKVEKQRGGECCKCGAWVYPPLTCMACFAGLDPEAELRKTNIQLTADIEAVRAKNAKLDAIARGVCNECIRGLGGMGDEGETP